MLGFGSLKFKGVDKVYIKDHEHLSDYKAAEKIGRVRLGKLCMYYRDLGVKYYVPYDYIDRSFTRVSEIEQEFGGPTNYYRLILVHDGKEFANLIFKEEKDVDYIHSRLQELHPEIEYGYIPPEKKK